MDIFLIVITIIIALLLLLSNFYAIIYFLDPAEKGFADSWFFKIVVLASLMLAWGQILALPLDVANSQGNAGTLDIQTYWEILYLAIFVIVTVILPTSMFFFESDESEPVCDRIWYTTKYMIFVIIIEGLILGLMYGLIGNTSIPVEDYTCDWSQRAVNGTLTIASCSKNLQDLVMPVSFPIYVMALMSFVG